MDYLKPGELNPVSPLSANYLLFQPEETRGALTRRLPSPSLPHLQECRYMGSKNTSLLLHALFLEMPRRLFPCAQTF